MAFQSGDYIGRYQLLSQIGGGGFGEVWSATDGAQTWAVKIYASQALLDVYERNLIRAEYEKTKNLSHQNVLNSVDFGEHQGNTYLVMPLAKGSLLTELRQRMASNTGGGQGNMPLFSEAELAKIIADVCDGLVYLQEKGLIHQDIKPANILLMEINGATRYVIADFGISTQVRSSVLRQTALLHKSDTGFAPAYASPEQLDGHVGKKSDIFSLGVLLYELATGSLPFQATGMASGQAVASGYRIQLNSEHYTQRFRKLVGYCLEKDPKKRPDAMQLLLWSDAHVREQWWSDDVSKWQQKQRYKWLYIGSAIAAALMLILGAVCLFKMRTNDNWKREYKTVRAFSEERAAVQSARGKWGFVDTKGKGVIDVQYDAVSDYANGTAAVQSACCCGYIDSNGKILVPLENKVCNQMKNGVAQYKDAKNKEQIFKVK